MDSTSEHERHGDAKGPHLAILWLCAVAKAKPGPCDPPNSIMHWKRAQQDLPTRSIEQAAQQSTKSQASQKIPR